MWYSGWYPLCPKISDWLVCRRSRLPRQNCRRPRSRHARGGQGRLGSPLGFTDCIYARPVMSFWVPRSSIGIFPVKNPVETKLLLFWPRLGTELSWVFAYHKHTTKWIPPTVLLYLSFVLVLLVQSTCPSVCLSVYLYCTVLYCTVLYYAYPHEKCNEGQGTLYYTILVYSILFCFYVIDLISIHRWCEFPIIEWMKLKKKQTQCD